MTRHDIAFLAALKKRTAEATAAHGEVYHSPEELLGVITEEYHEFLHAVHEGKGTLSAHAVDELLDIAAVCMKGARKFYGWQEMDKKEYNLSRVNG